MARTQQSAKQESHGFNRVECQEHDRRTDKVLVKLNLGVWGSVFAVPTLVVDEGLKFADGVKLKVLLCVLRNAGTPLDERAVSDVTGVNVTDIPEAFEYWISMGIFSKESSEYIPKRAAVEGKKENADRETVSRVETTDEEIDEIVNEIGAVKEKESKRERRVVTQISRPDYQFTSERLAKDKELQYLVSEVEYILKNTLSNSNISALLMLKDTCGLPPDVIIMIAQYVVSGGKGSIRAIEKMGIKWADEGIYTLEAAEEKLRRMDEASKSYKRVASIFGLRSAGSPSKKQLEYCEKWTGEWRFSDELLRSAYERCVDGTCAVKFEYIDKILKGWHEAGINTIEEVEEHEEKWRRERNANTAKLTKQKDKADMKTGTEPVKRSSFDINSIQSTGMQMYAEMYGKRGEKG